MTGRSGRSTVYAPRHAVATSQPLASGAGLTVLEEGGNAVDAAVTAAAVLSVTEPHMTGPGGDMFALLWSAPDRTLIGLDASGTAGSRADAEALLAEGHASVPERDARAVTVPGALAGWAALLDRYGSIPLERALAPAVRIAEGGFPVTPIIAHEWASLAPVLRADPGAAATFLPGGRVPSPGGWFTNPDLAGTFRDIGRLGVGTLYGGPLGERLVDGLDRLGGSLTLDDLARHEVRWVEPLAVDYHGVRLHELPPAGQGIAALQMLKLLEDRDLGSMGHNSSKYLHTLIEAKKLAYADLERFVADPEHMPVSTAALLAPEYVRERAARIDASSAAESVAPGAPAAGSDTVYLTAADEQGSMVSFINSIYRPFGSGVVVPGTGFALQNRGAGFSLAPGHPNRLAPGKRPFHTIIPAFVSRDGQPWMSFGVMGGPMQPQGHVQVLLNLLHFGMDPQEALDAPRFRHLDGRRVAVEELREPTATELGRLGHELLDPEDFAFGGAQAIVRLTRGWAAASDPRKDGMAVGG
ncbi:MAG: gamma-glutamyltransferase [Gemmatimonadota bacterium]|nr:gamma-glutamyltransferase [Gemmatimonadota bacterium]